MTDVLAGQIYDSIVAENKPRVFEHWHASSIAECPRAHHYKRLAIPPINKPGAGKMLRWQAGHIIEEVLRPHLKKIYPDLKSNVRLTSKKLDLTGEYDNYSQENALIIEVKSVHDGAIRYKRAGESRNNLREDSPYLSHEYQNHAYVLLLREKKLPVEKIHYIYVTLSGMIVTYETEVQPDILANVKKRLEVLERALQGELPDCICDATHPLYKSVMQYCDYKGTHECCSEELYNKFKETK